MLPLTMRTLLALAIVVPIGIACAATPPDRNGSVVRASLEPMVTTVHVVWGAGTNPCLGPVTMTFTAEVLNGNAGDQIISTLTGPGLPGQISDPVIAPDTLITHQYAVPAGSGLWQVQVVSVGGKVPSEVPGASLSAKAFATC
jgi:hypothetical protein